jgi:alkaline phosphatase
VRTNDERGEPTAKPMRDAKGRPFTTLGYANGPGYVGASGRPDLSQVDTADPHYRQESTVPLDSESHGGEDVPLYAGGPGAQLFHGVQEQSYIYYAIVAALGW